MIILINYYYRADEIEKKMIEMMRTQPFCAIVEPKQAGKHELAGYLKGSKRFGFQHYFKQASSTF